MITEIRLRNFKCFKSLDLTLAPLTLLAGLNGMGKSSVIQSLLLLRQSWLTNDLPHGRLQLSGEYTDLGTGGDVLFEFAEEDAIGIGLTAKSEWDFENNKVDFLFEHDVNADLLVGKWNEKTRSEQENFMEPLIDAPQALFGGEFHYIFAERFGPRKMLPLSERDVRRKNIGIRGEFVFHFLLAHGTDIVISRKDPRFSTNVKTSDEKQSSLLINQVDAWLQDISPGCHLTIDPVRRADFALGGFKFDQPLDVPTRPFRTTNVGFGLSYVLPVIVALLAASEGSMVLLENPEAHMHPKGQTRLGQLAARAAAAGVQVIVETHSDHFMDGARIDIRDGVLTPDKAAFHYFERKGVEASVVTPAVDSEGRMDFWPEGFFDQHQENLMQLLAEKFQA